jgi:hypothetical protein
MGYNENKADDAALALLLLNVTEGARVWKAMPWEVMDRLHEKGYISNPASKSKSVVLTQEGETLANSLFEKLFSESEN